jgi:hypothetical protein
LSIKQLHKWAVSLDFDGVGAMEFDYVSTIP